MTAVIVLIPLGIMFGLIIRAAKKAPQEYVDLRVLTEERHALENMEDSDEQSPCDIDMRRTTE